MSAGRPGGGTCRVQGEPWCEPPALSGARPPTAATIAAATTTSSGRSPGRGRQPAPLAARRRNGLRHAMGFRLRVLGAVAFLVLPDDHAHVPLPPTAHLPLGQQVGDDQGSGALGSTACPTSAPVIPLRSRRWPIWRRSSSGTCSASLPTPLAGGPGMCRTAGRTTSPPARARNSTRPEHRLFTVHARLWRPELGARRP